MSKTTIFKREVQREELIDKEFFDSFYVSDFINEDLFDNENEDRNLWNHLVKIWGDPSVQSYFDTVLVAYREIAYSEELLQTLALQTKFKRGEEKNKKKLNENSTTYALIKPENCRIVQFETLTPLIYLGANVNNKCKVEKINNTLEMIDRLRGEYTIVESVVDYLKKERDELNTKINPKDKGLLANDSKDLFWKDIYTPNMLIVPNLEKGLYYNINNLKRYPNITECYHYNKSRYNQIAFSFKARNSLKKNEKDENSRNVTKLQLFEGYFDKGIKKGEVKEIFYVTYFRSCFNILYFLKKHEVNELFDLIINDPLIKLDTKNVFYNTYVDYMDNIDSIKEKYGNRIPAIHIKDKAKKVVVSKSIDNIMELDDLESDYDVDFDDEVVETCNTIPKEDDIEDDVDIIEEIEDMTSDEEVEKKEEKLTDNNKLDYNLVKSLIYGYNNEFVFSFYGHLKTNLLSIAMTPNGKRLLLNTKKVPTSPKFLAKTINSSQELFTTNDDCTPFDVFRILSYRRSTLNSAGSGKPWISDDEKYLNNENLKYIDALTSKSETSGLTACISYFDVIANRIIKTL